MAKPILADLHTHTLASGHAYGTILENARAAADAGLKLYGFAEHGPATPAACDPFYFCNMKVIPRQLYGVTVLRGCELNLLDDGTYDLPEKYVSRLDYCYIGLHSVAFHTGTREENTRKLVKLLPHEKILFVSHPDDDNTPLDYDVLVPACREHHVALEVNNSSFFKLDRRKNVLENYRYMLSLCSRLRVPVMIGSDAHFPTDVGQVPLAYEFVQASGFDEDLILNLDPQRVLSFIHLEP